MTMKHEAIIQYRHSHKGNCLQTKEVKLLKMCTNLDIMYFCEMKEMRMMINEFSRAPLGYRFALGFCRSE